ncbi:NFACT family protein, partial [Candidatus Woesearchaeota archaeon]|nr:NFACT family protein [Candidatus Woesearchaeota archaeon]
GNIILCQNNKIIMPLSVQKWADRLVKKGEEYTPPSREHNPFNISLTNFEKLIKSSKDTISKTLAVGLGIGGLYAAEICLRLCIKKTEKSLDNAAVKKLYKTMQSLLQQKIEPVVVFDKKEVADITPFKLEYYATKRQEDFKTYSEAIDSVLSKDIQKKDIAQVEEKFAGRLEKIEKRLEMQRKNLTDQENKSKEFQLKGEKIYEKYQDLKTLFAEIKKMRKTMSWKEVKAKLKSVKYIKSINEKNGEIVIEIK